MGIAQQSNHHACYSIKFLVVGVFFSAGCTKTSLDFPFSFPSLMMGKGRRMAHQLSIANAFMIHAIILMGVATLNFTQTTYHNSAMVIHCDSVGAWERSFILSNLMIIISRPSSTGKNAVCGDMSGNVKINHDTKQAMISRFYVWLITLSWISQLSLLIPVNP